MVSINIQKRDLWFLSTIVVLLVGVGFVVAYNSGASPSVMGHSAEEIGFSPASYAGEESVTLPNGLIMKMGYIARIAAETPVVFGDPFGTALVSVSVTPYDAAGGPVDYEVTLNSVSVNGFTIHQSLSSEESFYWIAIGY